jgi:hypothetical protein
MSRHMPTSYWNFAQKPEVAQISSVVDRDWIKIRNAVMDLVNYVWDRHVDSCVHFVVAVWNDQPFHSGLLEFWHSLTSAESIDDEVWAVDDLENRNSIWWSRASKRSAFQLSR